MMFFDITKGVYMLIVEQIKAKIENPLDYDGFMLRLVDISDYRTASGLAIIQGLNRWEKTEITTTAKEIEDTIRSNFAESGLGDIDHIQTNVLSAMYLHFFEKRITGEHIKRYKTDGSRVILPDVRFATHSTMMYFRLIVTPENHPYEITFRDKRNRILSVV